MSAAAWILLLAFLTPMSAEQRLPYEMKPASHLSTCKALESELDGAGRPQTSRCALVVAHPPPRAAGARRSIPLSAVGADRST